MDPAPKPFVFCSANVSSHYPRSLYRKFPEHSRLWFQVLSVYCVMVLSFCMRDRSVRGPHPALKSKPRPWHLLRLEETSATAVSPPLSVLIRGATYSQPSFCDACKSHSLGDIQKRRQRSLLRLSPPEGEQGQCLQLSLLHRCTASCTETRKP